MGILALKGALTLAFIRRILFILIILSTLYVIPTTFSEKYRFPRQIIPQIPLSSGMSAHELKQKESDYVQFVKELETRKVFTAPVRTQKKVTDSSREKLNKIIEKLRLVGIIAGETKQAIVEDTQKGVSFYLKEGELFSEDSVTLDKIGADSIILECYGETFELYL